MTHTDVLLAKIDTVQRCLKRIADVTPKNLKHLKDDIDVQDIVVLNLQRAIQACVDIANHIIADKKLALPDQMKLSFELLKNAKIISEKACVKMKNMVGFRNVAVHDYESLNVEILGSIVKNHLTDFDDFIKDIVKFTTKKGKKNV